jgi:EamA-like transporter family.
MLYLILAILFSSGVFVAMRLFDRFKIDSHQAIAANYAIATLCGFLMSDDTGSIVHIADAQWFWLSLLTGFWFIFTYLLFAYSSPRAGVAITSMSSKLSVVIPTAAGIIFLNERLSLLATLGIALAITALGLLGNKSIDRKKQTEKSAG